MKQKGYPAPSECTSHLTFGQCYLIASIAGLLTGLTLVRWYVGSGLIQFRILQGQPFFHRDDDLLIAAYLAVLGGLVLGTILYNSRGRPSKVLVLGTVACPFNALLLAAIMATDGIGGLLIISVGALQAVIALVLFRTLLPAH